MKRIGILTIGIELGATAVQASVDGMKGKTIGIVGGNITYTRLRNTWEKKGAEPSSQAACSGAMVRGFEPPTT